MFRIGVITDEISQDFKEALRFAKEHGLECVELRSAWEKGPFEYTDEDFAKIAELTKKYELPLICISSPLFKCLYSDESERKAHIEGLKRLLAHKDELGFTMIRCFDFYKEDGVTMAQIADAFKEAITLCEAAGVTLVLESEPTTHSVNCSKIAETVNYVNSPTLRALYEPGNNIFGEPYEVPFPDGYNAVKDIFCHVHVKDALRIDGKPEVVAIGSGVVDYEGMLREFIASGYNGALVLEPHYKPKGMVLTEELMRNPKGSAFSAMGDIACNECITEINKILDKINK